MASTNHLPQRDTGTKPALSAQPGPDSPPQLVAKPMQSLMEEIRALGRLPRQSQAQERDEKKLYDRLKRAKAGNRLSESQLAELEQLEPVDASAARMDTLMQEIRALGHLPRGTPGLGEEAKLYDRLKKAKAKTLLSASQLAELAAMPVVSERWTADELTEALMEEIRAFWEMAAEAKG